MGARVKSSFPLISRNETLNEKSTGVIVVLERFITKTCVEVITQPEMLSLYSTLTVTVPTHGHKCGQQLSL